MKEGEVVLKKVMIILLLVALMIAATLVLWQFVPLFGVSWEDMLLRMEFDGYVKESLMDGVECPYSLFSIVGYSSMQGFPVILEIPGESGEIDTGISITIRADDGTWFQEIDPKHTIKHLGSTVTVPNGGSVYWEHDIYDAVTQDWISAGSFWTSDRDTTFIDAVIRKDGQIIGYFVGRFQLLYHEEYGRTGDFVYEMVGSASFPKIDGEYQDINEECIEARIQMIKDYTCNPPKLYLKSGD